MFKKLIKRPLYYLLTTLFIIFIISTAITIVIVHKDNYRDPSASWIERKFVAIADNWFIHPFYQLVDIINVAQYNIFSRGVDVRNLAVDYQRLKSEYALLKAENELLSERVKYQPTYGEIIATGRVLSDTNSFGSGVFTISVGSKQNVRFGDIVTTERGLVGKIVKLYDNIATVLPVRHLSSKIIGRIQEQNALVLLSGRHLRGAVIDYISDTVGLEKNMQVLTVADGVSMPAGIPIGKIIDPYQRPIKVQLNVDFARLDYVTIIRNIPLKTEDELKEKEGDLVQSQDKDLSSAESEPPQ